ncbi:hypothetical protein CEXT_750911 [Caerostris extrusa]|uniref:Uncharacterized protein n=1 Tax=Caerostris extrusa TaxID=172846 RepID=A0AAV4P2Q7_CAEEX|nr:hypothetical protein CEXT_750911 [Caerostris extrusa]
MPKEHLPVTQFLLCYIIHISSVNDLCYLDLHFSSSSSDNSSLPVHCIIHVASIVTSSTKIITSLNWFLLPNFTILNNNIVSSQGPV